MAEQLRLMCVLAHPDDESLGVGGILARYASEGVETHLVTATRGDRGWFGDPEAYPGPEALARTREGELRAAAGILGLRDVAFLGYGDGELDAADPDEAVGSIVAHLRRVRPQVVVTFDPFGVYGHPDHIAVCQLTTAAVVAAASIEPMGAQESRPHRVSKLYFLVETAANIATYQAVFGDLAMQIDGKERRATGWPDWAATTRVDTSAHWRQVWDAIACHRSQITDSQLGKGLNSLSEAQHKEMWGTQHFYRAFSLVNGGRQVESDLFEGLRMST